MPNKIILLICLTVVSLLFYLLDLHHYLTFEYLKGQQLFLQDYYATHTIITVLIFAVVYILVTSLSLPGAAPLTLVAGAIFGLLAGTILVSFVSTIGATIAFLIAKYLLHDFVQAKYAHRLKVINEGFNKEGAYYLFALRLVPVMPFFIINILMGLTKIKTRTFFLVSQVGMLPGTILYIFVGTNIGRINSPSEIFSWPIIFSFALLGIFPFIVKKTLNYFKINKKIRKYKKPKKFQYNMIVIGGGAGGLVAAYMGASLKAKVALIEKDKMGGDCLNTGCVPSKALIKTAKMVSYGKNFKKYGLNAIDINFSFSDVMQRVSKIIQKVEPHDSATRYTKLGVDCLSGEAKIHDPYHIKINDDILSTQKIIIATGASPLVPPIEGIDQINYLTSDTIWDLKEKPEKLIVLGGGPIGVELTQCFARLGVKVTIVEMMPQILIREDEEVTKLMLDCFKRDDIEIRTSHTAKRFFQEKGKKFLECEYDGEMIQIEFDEVLVALGRKANVSGFGLEELGVQLTPRGTIQANEYMQTNYPNIFVCGDVTGPYQFTHMAGYQGVKSSLNALFGWIKKFKVDYKVVPWTTFTDPEIARVGMNEKEATDNNIPFDITKYELSELDRAIIDGVDIGFVKVLTAKKSDRILGVTIVGDGAGELIAEFVLAMQNNIGLNKILQTIHIYPTMNEANKATAGLWKMSQTKDSTLTFLAKVFKWKRG